MKITIAGGRREEVKKISKLIRTINPEAQINGAPTVTETEQKKNYRKRFLVKHLQKFLSIRVSQVAYFYSNGRLSFLVTTDNKKYMVEYSMERLEGLLNPEQFFRINRSFIIAFDAVKQAEDYHGNRLIIDVQPGFYEKVIVSRERVSVFKKWLGK
ncbi:MAG: LytTR family DNA-binding domain-containing protein [Chitinophagaceae bacterium]